MKVAVGLRRVAAGKRTSGRRAAQIAPEPGMVTTAKSYREKKDIPLLEKVKET